jgi:hypothetical protein
MSYKEKYFKYKNKYLLKRGGAQEEESIEITVEQFIAMKN